MSPRVHHVQRLGALLLALALPLVGGRVIYHCAISGRDSFACCCQERVAEASGGSCCSRSHENDDDRGPEPCKCCDVSIFTIEVVSPSKFQLDLSEPVSVALVAESSEPALSHTATPSARGAPPRTGPLYILHAALLI